MRGNDLYMNFMFAQSFIDMFEFTNEASAYTRLTQCND